MDLSPLIKYFLYGSAPRTEKILVAILLISIPVMLIVTPIYILNNNGERKPQPAIMGGLEIPPRPETTIKVDTFFNDTDYAGDTACFEYINNHKILLRCVCTCEEYKLKKASEKHQGVGD